MRSLELLGKAKDSLSEHGLMATLKRAVDVLSPFSAYNKMLRLSTAEKRFERIYQSNLWNCDESASGTGSSLVNTAYLRKKLPVIFGNYQIQSILDAPCGDFNWMSHLLEANPVITSYIGADIVAPLINDNINKYGSQRINFRCLDITKDVLPISDLMIVRDCLFHLSYQDIYLYLENFCRTDIKYLLTTSHILDEDFKNTDIVSGDFRLIDIFRAPFNFPSDTLERIEDYVPPGAPREMCLLSRSQIEVVAAQLKESL
jgi:hypothetical protein